MKKSKHVTLVYPPQHMPDMPHMSLPLLKAELQKQGIEARVIDTNIDFYHYALGSTDSQGIRTPLNFGNIKGYIDNRIEVEVALEAFGSRFDAKIGLMSSSLVHDHRHSEKVLDSLQPDTNPFYRFFEERLEDIVEGTDIVGISIGIPEQIIPTFTLASLIWEHHPDIFVAIGGNTFSRVAREIGNSRLSIYYDIGIEKEAETRFPAIVKAIRKKRDPEPILSNPKYDVPDVATVPDFSDLNLSLYFSPETVLPVLGGKGCYYNACDFCAITRMYGNDGAYRGKKPEDVVKLLRGYSEQGVKLFKFNEESHHSRVALAVATAVRNGDLDVHTEAFANLEPWILDETYRDVGKSISRIMYGYESASPRVLRLNDKRGERLASRSDEIFKRAYDLGIAPFAFLMAGLPGEREEDVQATIDAVVTQKAIRNFVVTPYSLDKHSPDACSPEKKGFEKVRPSGDLSCHYQYEIDGENPQQKISERAAHMLTTIHRQRDDLTLMSSFLPAARLHLFARFGNNVASEYLSQFPLPSGSEDMANSKYLAARVERKK